MIKVVYFILPSGLTEVGLENLGLKSVDFLPVVGPSVSYLKKAKKVTKMANPINAGARGISVISEFCFGKAAVLSIECLLWFGFSTVGGVTANPVLIAIGAEMGNLVMEEILDE